MFEPLDEEEEGDDEPLVPHGGDGDGNEDGGDAVVESGWAMVTMPHGLILETIRLLELPD